MGHVTFVIFIWFISDEQQNHVPIVWSVHVRLMKNMFVLMQCSEITNFLFGLTVDDGLMPWLNKTFIEFYIQTGEKRKSVADLWSIHVTATNRFRFKQRSKLKGDWKMLNDIQRKVYHLVYQAVKNERKLLCLDVIKIVVR